MRSIKSRSKFLSALNKSDEWIDADIKRFQIDIKELEEVQVTIRSHVNRILEAHLIPCEIVGRIVASKHAARIECLLSNLSKED